MTDKKRQSKSRDKKSRSDLFGREVRCVSKDTELLYRAQETRKSLGTTARKKTISTRPMETIENTRKLTVKRTPSAHQTTGASNQPPAPVRSPDLPPTPDDLEKNQNK
ncbi:unnamed protein product [Caenorhabditis auriculariae]|uniref:Uncharacterized protein n=1 Tax=Caenorhabditis auriculariae TaxID=2777116 RepID=A0A8S1GTA7_9PELO|nr:unnamed protein product [Caenorhabditis auriculariae]